MLRSLYPIGGVVFDGDRAPMTGAEVRDYHTTIKGVDAKGRRYHALNPDVFYWAHSTFFVGTIIVAERFCGGITEAEKRQLFDEHVAWYRMYGMSMRPVPKTWEDFQVYWDHMCREVLEDNKATRRRAQARELSETAIRTMDSRMAVEQEPAPPRRAVHGVAHRWALRSSGPRTDGLHLVVPRRMAAPPVWRPGQRGVQVAAAAQTHTSARQGRLGPRHGLVPADAPLPETPARNLPPLDERTNPMHYCPKV